MYIILYKYKMKLYIIYIYYVYTSLHNAIFNTYPVTYRKGILLYCQLVRMVSMK